MKSFKKHLVYWVLPGLVVGTCMYIYFFDFLGMSYLIAPEYNREFGIIENIQLLTILAIILVAYKNLRKATLKSVSLIFILILIGSIFIFLEEIDYGLHFYDLLSGKTLEQLKVESWNNKSMRNIHNHTGITRYMKLLAYILFSVIIVSPVLFKKLKISNKYFNFLAPDPYFIYTLLSMVLLNRAALYIDDFLKNEQINALNSNVSEFEEVFIYYIVFLYVLEKSTLLLNFEVPETMEKISPHP